MNNGEICVLAHNIRSLWNIGALFRNADAFGVSKIYITGYSATPPRREISKTAIGAEEWIAWEYNNDPYTVISKLQKDGWTICGLEITDDAVELSSYKPNQKTCLLLGHEVLGIDENILQLCDNIIYIPMQGKKESLNVSVAAGIALYGLRKH